MSTVRPFFGGVPTGPDVLKLVERFGVPDAGVLTYDDIASVLGVPWKSSRFRSVVEAWRARLLREHNLETDAVPGVGIKVLAETERLGKGTRTFRAGARRVRRAWIQGRAIRLAQLDERERQKVEHFNAVAWRVHEATTQAVREVLPSRPPQQLPQPPVAS